MINVMRERGRRNLRLRTQLVENRAALYTALTHHTERCICRLTAEALLEQAQWDTADFIREYEAGHLDG